MEEHSRDLKMKVIGLFCFFLLLEMHSSCDASKTISTETKRFDVQKYLSRFNKTPVKSIQSPDGDIIDCVDIYQQPAMDHPLLRNHSIQMKPKSYPKGLFPEGNSAENTKFKKTDNGISETIIDHQLWHKNGRCPDGTIPIRRTTKEDLLRAESMERFGKKTPGSIPRSKSDIHIDASSRENHESVMGLIESGENLYGAKASVNVWQPHIQQPDEFSSSQIWVVGMPFDDGLNSIEAGWQVNRVMYGDNRTRLFTFWTSDDYRTTGCYNLQCAGFVQTNKDIALGAALDFVSAYSGIQYYIDLTIFKDSSDGEWWLKFGKDKMVGYWPSSLFTRLNDNAIRIQFGGEVINKKTDGKHTTTEMGSGHLSEEGYTKASYIRNIQWVNEAGSFESPDRLYGESTKSLCYDLNFNTPAGGDDWDTFFYFGGPGRSPGCP